MTTPATLDSEFFNAETTEAAPSLTYRCDFVNKRIIGTVDGRDAIVQCIKKTLSTDKYAHEIYDWYYGNEIYTLAGQSYEYIVADLPRIIEEALLVDDRILSIEDYVFTRIAIDKMEVSFTVRTVYGDVSYEMEVNT